LVSKPHTKTAEEENAPKPPSLCPAAVDLRIWGIYEKAFEMMKAHGYDATTDFREWPNIPSHFWGKLTIEQSDLVS
jgi:hypothetical protein